MQQISVPDCHRLQIWLSLANLKSIAVGSGSNFLPSLLPFLALVSNIWRYFLAEESCLLCPNCGCWAYIWLTATVFPSKGGALTYSLCPTPSALAFQKVFFFLEPEIWKLEAKLPNSPPLYFTRRVCLLGRGCCRRQKAKANSGCSSLHSCPKGRCHPVGKSPRVR